MNVTVIHRRYALGRWESVMTSAGQSKDRDARVGPASHAKSYISMIASTFGLVGELCWIAIEDPQIDPLQ